MTAPHRLDPPVQMAAAGTAGKLVAQGILAVEDIVPDLYRAAIRAGYSGDRRGLRCRLFWRVRESAEHWGWERDRAAWLIRQDAFPRAEAWADPDEITRFAHKINENRGEALLRSEVVAVVDEVLEDRLRRDAAARSKNKKRGRRHVR
jgi:hypothetical protein